MIDGVEVVRHPRARVARLSVDPATGRVRLTVPKRMALARAVAWASEKAEWIAAQRAALPEGRPFVPGAVVPIADREVRLRWDAGASRTVRLVAGPVAGSIPAPAWPPRSPSSSSPGPPSVEGYAPPPTSPRRRPRSPSDGAHPFAEGDPGLRRGDAGGKEGRAESGETGAHAADAPPAFHLTCGGPREGFEARIERWLRREALRVLTEDTVQYAASAGVAVTQVAVADPKARWGSCSATGTIRYSWRLLLAPGFVRRATVAHEVAHRIHMHHGPDFHALVARLFEGDADAARHWLRAHGAGLHWYGRASSS